MEGLGSSRAPNIEFPRRGNRNQEHLGAPVNEDELVRPIQRCERSSKLRVVTTTLNHRGQYADASIVGEPVKKYAPVEPECEATFDLPKRPRGSSEDRRGISLTPDGLLDLRQCAFAIYDIRIAEAPRVDFCPSVWSAMSSLEHLVLGQLLLDFREPLRWKELQLSPFVFVELRRPIEGLLRWHDELDLIRGYRRHREANGLHVDGLDLRGLRRGRHAKRRKS